MLMEQLQYNLLFRWFVGLSANEPVWHVSGGIKGNHFRRVERVPMGENAGIGHTSAMAAG
jgi:hypothetical protein